MGEVKFLMGIDGGNVVEDFHVANFTLLQGQQLLGSKRKWPASVFFPSVFNWCGLQVFYGLDYVSYFNPCFVVVFIWVKGGRRASFAVVEASLRHADQLRTKLAISHRPLGKYLDVTELCVGGVHVVQEMGLVEIAQTGQAKGLRGHDGPPREGPCRSPSRLL